MKVTIPLLAILVFSSGYFLNESFAEILPNQAFLLEGSGFAVTEESIKISEIDLGLSTKQQKGSTINFQTEDGFVTLDDDEFTLSKLEGKFLREGRYLRVNGNIESSSGFDTTISFFGRLVEESKDGLVYGFTGRITTQDESYKVIYTAKLSTLSKIDTKSTTSTKSQDLTIHILKGSSSQGVSDSYVTSGSAKYFSKDRLSVNPGTTITIINDDVKSHNIISGKENYGDRYIPFTPDGRIATNVIAPGETASITFDDLGTYKLYDPDYPWMRIVVVSFPNVDSLVLGTGKNLGN